MATEISKEDLIKTIKTHNISKGNFWYSILQIVEKEKAMEDKCSKCKYKLMADKLNDDGK